ncbi:MAG: glycosyltransferase family 2 protein [Candidatus Omnitrophica bacterium]|nr:glycosyltransferase family 2 protein [Candidatus Omnitrophota bacterium]
MEKKLVSIIIPTYNREKEVLECISSLLNISYPNFEIIVVDNASQDNTANIIKEKFSNIKNIKILELSQNLGAAGGRNEGIRHAKGEYLCFVDNDNIVDKNFLTELVKLAETDEKIGFVGPKMYYFNDPERIWYAGAEISLLTSRGRYIGISEIDKGQHDRIREVGHIPNVWLVKKCVIEKIGVLDTSYVVCYEESDWAMRARKAGYKIMFCPTAVVYHNIPLRKISKGLRGLIGFDNPYKVFYAARNRTLFMKKFASKLSFILYLLIFNNILLIQYCLIFLYYRRSDLVKSYIKGYLSGIIK